MHRWGVSYHNENKISEIDRQIRKHSRKLQRLEAIEHPSIWIKISIRFTRLEMVTLNEKLQIEIQKIYQ